MNRSIYTDPRLLQWRPGSRHHQAILVSQTRRFADRDDRAQGGKDGMAPFCGKCLQKSSYGAGN